MLGKPRRAAPPDPGLMGRVATISQAPGFAANVYCDISSRARSPRDPAFKPATARLGAGDRCAVVVKNLSEHGARLEFFRRHVLTEKLYLVEPSLPIARWAKVIWQTEGAAGIQFIADKTD